jgi:hypothetical protein
VAITRRVSLLALTLASCASADRPHVEAPVTERARLVAEHSGAVTFREPCDSGGGFRATWRPGTPPIDRGIGVLTFPDSFIGQRSDTMLIRTAPSARSAVDA